MLVSVLAFSFQDGGEWTMRLGMVPQDDGEAASAEVTLCQSQG